MESTQKFLGEVASIIEQPIMVIVLGFSLVCAYTVFILPIAYYVNRLDKEAKIKYTKILLIPQKILAIATILAGVLLWIKLLLTHNWL